MHCLPERAGFQLQQEHDDCGHRAYKEDVREIFQEFEKRGRRAHKGVYTEV